MDRSIKNSMAGHDDLSRLKDIFYGRGADGKINFKGGDEIKINKPLLASKSSYFDDEFFGQSSTGEVYISDFDLSTFRLFLDCLMGFKQYSALDSLLIFPIAHKYKTDEAIKRCIEALTPKELNETVCHTLNLAIYYKLHGLTDKVTNFIKEMYGIRLFLETEQYCFLLEPPTLAKLLQYVSDLDSDLLKKVCDWAKNYMQNFMKSESLHSFFEEHKILDIIHKCRFESFQSIFDIRDADEAKDLFTVEQICSLFKEKIEIENPRRFPNKSMWLMVKKGETLTETYGFAKPPTFQSGDCIQMTLELWTNEILFMDKGAANDIPVTCQGTFIYNCGCFQNNNYYYLMSRKNTINLLNNPIKKDGKYIYEILWPQASYLLSLQSFDITYTFNDNCKILKASMEGISSNSGILCYTYGISRK